MSKTLCLLMGMLYLVATLTGIEGTSSSSPLQCWHCSSDTGGSEEFCGEVFSESHIPYDYLKERNISILKACNSTINHAYEKAVCRKTVEEVQGKTVTKRFCYYTNKADPLYSCNTAPTDSNVRRSYCEDCTTDKCNSAKKMSAMIGSLFVPVILAKLILI